MRSYAKAGDVEAALKHYDHLVGVLADELAVDPRPETRSLAPSELPSGAPAAFDGALTVTNAGGARAVVIALIIGPLVGPNGTPQPDYPAAPEGPADGSGIIPSSGETTGSSSSGGSSPGASYPTTTYPTECYPTTTEYHPTTTEYHPTTTEYHPTTTEYHPTTTQYHPTTTAYSPTTTEPVR